VPSFCWHRYEPSLALLSPIVSPTRVPGCLIVTTDPQAIPARPWERKALAASPQQAAPHTAHQPLLQQAASVVQACLHQTSSKARVHPSSSAAAALGQLFVPSVLFLAAVLTADRTSQQGLQQAAVAATCEAAAALAAAPTALLPATGQTGLPAVLSSCRALLLACKVSTALHLLAHYIQRARTVQASRPAPSSNCVCS
jgi:hypothetical protein